MKTNKNQSFFEKVPGFLATIREIEARGFFEEIRLQIGGHEGNLHAVSFQGTGFLPVNAEYSKPGIKPIANVPKMFKAVGAQIRQGNLSVTNCHSEVKNEKWNLWDKNENHVIGERGVRVSFTFNVLFV